MSSPAWARRRTTTTTSSSSSTTSSSTTTIPSGTTAGFVTRNGTQLTVNGKPWNFAAYNLPCAQPFMLSAGQLGYYLDNIRINSQANAVRVWFFQSNGGPSNWAPFDQVIAALKSRGMRAIPTLVNEWGNQCEPTTQMKLLPWYQTGYTQANDGYPLSYHDFAVQVAAHYANEPTIAFWQLVNEAQAPSPDGSCNATAATSALQTFSDAMVGAIHQVDTNHLINLGTQGTDQCGLDGPGFSAVHSSSVDLCEYHDYGLAAQALPSNGSNLLRERIADCHAIGKPIFVGESGIAGNVQPDGSEPPCSPWPDCGAYPLTAQTLQQRATFFQAKIQQGAAAGLVGYAIWFKSPFYSPSTANYAIGDNDPTEPVLAGALITNAPLAPASVVPEVSWPVLLAIPALAGLAVIVVLGWRRRRDAPASAG